MLMRMTEFMTIQKIGLETISFHQVKWAKEKVDRGLNEQRFEDLSLNKPVVNNYQEK